MKDERRQVSEDAACSTAKLGEESPLRPAGARGSSGAGVKALADINSAAMECGSDSECDASSGEAVEEVIGEQIVSLVSMHESSFVQSTPDGEPLRFGTTINCQFCLQRQPRSAFNACLESCETDHAERSKPC